MNRHDPNQKWEKRLSTRKVKVLGDAVYYLEKESPGFIGWYVSNVGLDIKAFEIKQGDPEAEDTERWRELIKSLSAREQHQLEEHVLKLVKEGY